VIRKLASGWARIVHRYFIAVLLVAAFLTVFAVKQVSTIDVSTDIEALMPEGARSVQALNQALKKTGSFASVQVSAWSEEPGRAETFIAKLKTRMDPLEWVQSSQYFEDIEALEAHKLLLLSYEELLELEADINAALPTLLAREFSEEFGSEFSFTLREKNVTGRSTDELDDEKLGDIDAAVSGPSQTKQMFTSEDGRVSVLIAWPKPGWGSLSESKLMVDQTQRQVSELLSESGSGLKAGVAGRIASQVEQFDVIIRDLALGLISAVTIIALLLAFAFRSAAAIPLIFIPLVLGIVWTMGLTAMTIGNLNLITVFLTLILFGLGIDFAIHNFSRYTEERRNGANVEQSITTVITQTGAASLIAALTTAFSFYALMFTEFRAFTEFGFIAGSGILLTFTMMYSVFPALLVLFERLGWRVRPKRPKKEKTPGRLLFDPLSYRRPILIGTVLAVIFSVIFAPQMRFEQNVKNLEAQQSAELTEAKSQVREVLKTSNSRAIIVAETYEEVVEIVRYFQDKIQTDTETPTIKEIASLLDFVPDPESQARRLDVIHRLQNLAEELQGIDPEKYKASQRYLTAGDLTIADLPPTIRRSYTGIDEEPGFLLYVENAVNLDDSRLAAQFYDDAASFTVKGKQYFSASQSFILVEMLALMKADAIKAVGLVALTTALMVFLFIRTIRGTLIVLTPPLLGVLLTVGIMGAFGPSLSIMNMVILPSLVGISVDNGIHIFHRFAHDKENADIGHIMNTTGRAAVLTTCTTLLGFGGMITASMGGLRSMAILAIIGFTCCLIATWVLLPVIIDVYRGKQGVRALS